MDTALTRRTCWRVMQLLTGMGWAAVCARVIPAAEAARRADAAGSQLCAAGVLRLSLYTTAGLLLLSAPVPPRRRPHRVALWAARAAIFSHRVQLAQASRVCLTRRELLRRVNRASGVRQGRVR